MVWAPDYLTGDDIKAFVRVQSDMDDAQYALYATAISRLIDRATHRQFGIVGAPEVRTYPVRYSRTTCRWVADVDDFMSTSGLVIPGDAPRREPLNASQTGKPWERVTWVADPSGGSGSVDMTALWGWSAIPAGIQVAARLQANRLAARQFAPFGVAGSPQGQGGGEMRLLERLDPDVTVLCKPFCRKWYSR